MSPADTEVGAATGGGVADGRATDEPATPLVLDPATHRAAGGRLLLGGARGRAVRLTAGGGAALDRVLGAGPVGAAEERLAQRLVATGLAHPRPAPAPALAAATTVVVPVHGRAAQLRRCLAALDDVEVLVVDDASPPAEAAAVADACAAHGARLLRLDSNLGPAGARNAGIAATDGELVALVDSDVEVRAGWLAALAGHLRDPDVAAVAPRVVPAHGPDQPALLVAHERDRFPLDMGTAPAAVSPDGRVAYVPSAALVLRRAALDGVAGPGGFDPALRVGEDVDLVWRLHDAGWTLRYEPTVEVRHHEPTGWAAVLRRRRGYGRSAAGLARRHPGRVAHLRGQPLHGAAAAALLLGRPVPAALAAAAAAVRPWRQLRGAGADRGTAASMTTDAVVGGVVGLLRGAAMVAWPVALGLALGRGRRGRALLGGVALPQLLDWLDRRPDAHPVPWAAAAVADDLAYGLGVLEGCIAGRTLDPLLPRRAGTPGTRPDGPSTLPDDDTDKERHDG